MTGDAPVKKHGVGFYQKQPSQRDLIVTHNLSAIDLEHAYRLGGIPVPTLAVTKVDNPLDGFGEITLIGNPAMADPMGYAETKEFGADIYSPRYPLVSYKLDKAGLHRLNEILASYNEGHELYGGDVRNIEFQPTLPECSCRGSGSLSG